MISYLQGKIILKKEKFIILDVNGVGYKVFLSQKTLSKIPEVGQNINPVKSREAGISPKAKLFNRVKLFCFLHIRENSLALYGFLDYKELEFFEIVEGISGVGPKASLEISALGPLEKLKEKILAHDEKIFEKIPGIGRKKAMAIILELSGKIKEVAKKEPKEIDETEEALVNLGFPRQRVKEALKRVPKEIEDVEGKVKQALKILGK